MFVYYVEYCRKCSYNMLNIAANVSPRRPPPALTCRRLPLFLLVHVPSSPSAQGDPIQFMSPHHPQAPGLLMPGLLIRSNNPSFDFRS